MWIWLLRALLLFTPLFSHVNGHSSRGKAIIFSKSTNANKECGEEDCVQHAECTTQQECNCQGPRYGVGTFQCYNQDQLRFQIIDNQFSPTSKGEGEGMAIPGDQTSTYKLINVQTKGTGIFSTCQLQANGIFVFEDKRLSLLEVELHIEVILNNKEEKKTTLSLRGSCKSNIYKYELFCKTDSLKELTLATLDGSGSGDGSVFRFNANFDDEDYVPPANTLWQSCSSFDLGGGVERKVKVDVDNFGVIDLKDQCGITVKLLASHDGSTAGSTEELSGLAIIMEQSNDPTFSDSGGYLNGHSSPTRRKRQAVSDIENKFVFVMTYGTMSDHMPDESRSSTDTINTYQSLCQGDYTAIEKCSRLLYHDLLRCLDRTKHSKSISPRAWALVNHCLRYVCTGARSSCYLLYQQLHTLGCAANHWNWIRSTLDCPSDSHRPPHK